jgi:membrane associated rhomboid family serine protease
MDLVILPIGTVSLIAICIMIGTLTISYFKKWLMTYALIISNFIVFILVVLFRSELIFGFSNGIFKYAGLAFRPIYLSLEYSPQLYTLFTSMFIHSGFAHILGNMLVFFFIGMAFEHRIGWKKFLIIYLLTGVCGTITHSILNLGSIIPLVGASGAIFGIMGAFAYSYPRDEVVMPIPLGIIMVLRRIKVIYAVIIFAALETIIVIIGTQDNTAHFAHLGGLVGGVILASILLGKKETHGKKGETIYYDSYVNKELKKIDFSALQKLATTTKQKEMLERIENETVSQVRDIWLEHFIEEIKCPKCKNSLNHFDRKIWCEKCDFKTNY